MANESKMECFNAFISKATKRFAPWDEAKVKHLLKEQFGFYQTDLESQYTAFLVKKQKEEAEELRRQEHEAKAQVAREEAAQFAASPDEQERRKQLAEEQYGPEFCPTCGEKTTPFMGWWSAIYGMPGWKCSSGGISHFLKWARENRSKHAEQSISNAK